jgi:hypothetical protein
MMPGQSLPRAERRMEMHAAVSPLPNRVPAESSVMLRLTIEADSVSQVRQAVIAACGESVEFMPPQKIPRSTQVKVWLVLTESAVPDAMGATLRAVPCGEISRVFHHAQGRSGA